MKCPQCGMEFSNDHIDQDDDRNFDKLIAHHIQLECPVENQRAKDLFAACALKRMEDHCGLSWSEFKPIIVKHANEYADAMMVERSKHK